MTSMIEPVALEDFFLAFFAGGLVVVGGLCYALLFGLARAYRMPRLMPWAHGAYAVLAVSTLTLARVMHFEGGWQAVTITLLVGYLLAPYGIWRLCVGTHGVESPPSRPRLPFMEGCGRDETQPASATTGNRDGATLPAKQALRGAPPAPDPADGR
ncbi:MAG: hypothetical protein D6819_06545 [Gammaproteobacteria bacterium]|nr:MAG: hypothetical protein D6819_06545 [Gammaproteobacteria bacterium]